MLKYQQLDKYHVYNKRLKFSQLIIEIEGISEASIKYPLSLKLHEFEHLLLHTKTHRFKCLESISDAKLPIHTSIVISHCLY